MKFKKVLALSPHTDDAELGAGGTLAKLVEEGSDVTVFAFSAPRKILETEFQNSLETLEIDESKIFDFKTRKFKSSRQEILDILYDYNQENNPDLVLAPSPNDLHQDHQVITNEAMRAFKTSTIFGYELPWNNIHFDQNCFVSLNKSHLEKKNLYGKKEVSQELEEAVEDHKSGVKKGSRQVLKENIEKLKASGKI